MPPRAELPRSCPLAQTLPPEQLSSQTECPLPSPGSFHTSPPRPLIPPTTLIIGDSITRDIRFINAITRCFPGATVPVIMDKILCLLPSLPASITKESLSLNTWLNSACSAQNLFFIDNFNLFWDRASLFKGDRIGPNRQGTQTKWLLTYCNLFHP